MRGDPADLRADRWHRRLEVAALCAAAGLGITLAWEVAAAGVPGRGWLALAALLLAYPLADVVSGLVHWSADRVLSEQTPWLGPRFVQPFREHHDDPAGITRHDFVETNGNTCVVLVPFLAVVASGLDPADGRGACFLQSLALGLALWLCLTNEFHKWAHAGPGRGVVGWLQRRGLVLAPAHHAVHHRPPHDRRFCITSGWCNAPLDALGWLAADPPRVLARGSALTHPPPDETGRDREDRQYPAGHRRPAG